MPTHESASVKPEPLVLEVDLFDSVKVDLRHNSGCQAEVVQSCTNKSSNFCLVEAQTKKQNMVDCGIQTSPTDELSKPDETLFSTDLALSSIYNDVHFLKST